MEVRLATYNIKCFPWLRTPIRRIVDWVVRNCDIVAFQEVWCRHTELAAELTAHGWTFLRPVREDHIAGFFGSGLAFAWKPTFWQLADSRFYPFMCGLGVDALVPKGWFRVELTHRTTGQTVRLVNTHKQSDYNIGTQVWLDIVEGIRMKQALEMTEVELRQRPLPLLFVGDMNTPMCWFRGFRWLGDCQTPTFPPEAARLDHCAAPRRQPWQVLEHRVAQEAGSLSDHLPVVWRLRWGHLKTQRASR